jgi:hypothetical protein
MKREEVISKDDFTAAFKGKFYGILKWHQLDELWVKVKKEKDEGWYLYAIGSEPPTELTQGNELEAVIDEINMLLRREHDEDYCGIVYADNLETPSFIKVFDPNNVGTSCSIAKTAPLPGWVISKMKPTDLSAPMKQTAKRRRWWDRLFN